MENTIRFFQEGGLFMYPIGLVLLIGIGIAIERWLFLFALRKSNKDAFDHMMPMLRRKDYNGIMQSAQRSETAIIRIVGAALIKMGQKQSRDSVESALDEGLMEVIPRIEKRTQYLATLANVATLLGLLGTIIGLIAAFTAVANADPTEKATLLSQSISVAMNTTAFGLISAIPLLLLHSFLQARTVELTDSLEMACVRFMNIITDKSPAVAQGSPAARGQTPVQRPKPRTP